MLVPEQLPLLYWFEGQLASSHVVQVPLATAEESFRNCPLLHVGCALQPNPFVVPLHEPVRYCEEAQSAFEHAEHVYPLVVLEQLPLLYCPPAQVALSHVVQVPLAVAEALFRNCPSGHVGWPAHV